MMQLLCFSFSLLFYIISVSYCQVSTDTIVLKELKQHILNSSALQWIQEDVCQWNYVECSTSSKRVTRIQLGGKRISGTLPASLSNLSELVRFEVMNNNFSGEVPNLSGLSRLQYILLHDNHFSYLPSDFFNGMTSLKSVYLDNNPFDPWEIPSSLSNASSLQEFSAVNASVNGTLPDFFSGNVFPVIETLRLSFNYLEGTLPPSFSGSSISTLWINGQKSDSRLNGSVIVLQNMTSLTEAWLHGNQFTGPIPNLTELKSLRYLSLRDNQLTGVVPQSLLNLDSLKIVNLTNNLLQGPTPKFPSSVEVDMIPGTNSFCLSVIGESCNPLVDRLLAVAKGFGYPSSLAENWKQNDPCVSWMGITCSSMGNISVINFRKMGLTGTITPDLASISSLQKIILSDNAITGTIPSSLASMPSLTYLDLSNNKLHGKVPNFTNVKLIVNGNPDIGKNVAPSQSLTPPSSGKPGSPSSGANRTSTTGSDASSSSSTTKTAVVLISVLSTLCILGLGVLLWRLKTKRYGKVRSPTTKVIRLNHSGDDGALKIALSGSIATCGAESFNNSVGSGSIHVVESGSLVISIQVLRSVTNDFSEENILGKGGFGTVYKGELHDGTKIAVKRMNCGPVNEKGLAEFKSEIAVLTRVRHRNLVALLGYCLDGNEKLLVYEYMPQGTLSSFIFHWKDEQRQPLEWKERLKIALDVARGVEYLHGLAQQSFIHRDLKPSNILLDDEKRAKVADFGLVRLAPEEGNSIETRLAGTFGYLAPEYAATGKVTTKVDVFSFGVILMEMISGRKALDDSRPVDEHQLVLLFHKMFSNKLHEIIDATLERDEDTLSSITKVAELACHCTRRDPNMRPDMGHLVVALFNLIPVWKPSEQDSDDICGIDLDMTLPQALKKWKEFEGKDFDDSSSSIFSSGDNTQTSIPTRPSGFANSFTSADGR